MSNHRHHCLDSSNRLPATRVHKAARNRHGFPHCLLAEILRKCWCAVVVAGFPLLGFLAGCDAGQVVSTDSPQSSERAEIGNDSHLPAGPSENFLPESSEIADFSVSQTDSLASTPGTSELSATAVSFTANTSLGTARQWLDAVIGRYRQANRYSDSGFVRLVYRRLGERHEDQAPLSVAFVREQALHVKAYAAEFLVARGRFQAILNDPLTNNFDGQVVDRILDAKMISLSEIYSDPELTHFATAGLGGPAPQLELLLAEKPLAGLFEGTAKLSLGQVETLNTTGATAAKTQPINCQTLEIDTGSLVYRLWIDTQTGLVRRIELPSEAAGLGVDPSVTDVRLTIELQNAQFDISASESFQLPNDRFTGSGIKRVKELVPLPPPIISELLGRPLPEFRLTSSDQRQVITAKGSDRPTTVMLWVADHPASRMAASQLQIVADTRETAGKKDARIMIVMAEPRTSTNTLVAPNDGATTGSLLRSWKVGLPFADDLKAVGRDVFKIAEAPTLVVIGPSGVLDWFQPRVGPEMAMQLPLLLEDLANGKEVGKEIRAQYEADQQTYKKLLAEAASD